MMARCFCVKSREAVLAQPRLSTLWYSLGQWRFDRLHDARLESVCLAPCCCKQHLDATCLCDRYNLTSMVVALE